MFKWTGGKRKEIPRFAPYFPRFVADGSPYVYVEPFVGGGAVFWHLANPDSAINDWDGELVNFYEQVAAQDEQFLAEVSSVAELFAPGADRDAQAEAYYRLRDLDRGGRLGEHPGWLRAARFFVVTQLAFSGMRRFNADGEFNVPFGHYRSFNASALRSEAHTRLLRATAITQGDYGEVLEHHDNPRTFVFVDPPYTRIMKKYSPGATFDDDSQRELAAKLLALRYASFMLVIDRSPLTEELYRGHIATTYTLSYGVNIKNRFSQASEHLVVCNYQTPA